MQLSRFLFGLTWLLLPIAIFGTTWLYLYPLFHGCAFPQPNRTSLPLLSSQAPFRLLALGDPQLEGDSSLPDPNAPIFPSLQNVAQDVRYANYEFQEARDILLTATKGAVKDLRAWLEGYRKKIDLWGNDWYLAHIVRSLRWWTEPTHISVLGDLLGSQWITDGEFEARAGRYWGTVMRGLDKVPNATMGLYVESDHYDQPQSERKKSWGGTTEMLGADKAWEKRVINIAGNHDIGYAGDIDNARVERFERAFGSVNWDLWLTLPQSSHDTTTSNEPESSTSELPALRLVVLNTMNLDTPAWTDTLQAETYSFMNHIITTSRHVSDKTHATILLTHIPLHKEPGVCVDSPYFDFFEGGHGIREQNMLSEHASKIVLESIFGLNANKDAEGAGMGRRGVVVNGHDHEGCDVVHYIRQPSIESTCNTDNIEYRHAYWPSRMVNETKGSMVSGPSEDATSANETTANMQQELPTENGWKARRFPTRTYDVDEEGVCMHIPSSPHLREITLRSMMGDFSGYAGFLSAWFDASLGERGEWVIEFSTCGVGVQHWWWAVHIVNLILVIAFVAALVTRAAEVVRPSLPNRLSSVEASNHEKTSGRTERSVQRKQLEVVDFNVEPGTRSMGTITARRG